MKKNNLISLMMAVLLPVSLLLGGCGTAAGPEDGGRLRIVATIFPAWDWTREILGGRAEAAELILLTDNGVDMHSYQPSAADLAAISGCDLFLYVGGESDRWVQDALAEAVNGNRIAVSLLKALGDAAREEELTEGMQAEEDAEEGAYDEHVWLSLKNAAILCREIAGRLEELDPEHRGEYAENAAAYISRLDALDRDYAAAVEAAATRSLVFADRFPFRYLAEDYGLDCYAAFPGCSAETEASFETIVFLADKVDALGLHALLTLETGDGALAETVARTAKTEDLQILQMNSLQSVTAKAIAGGASYLGGMEENLEVLAQALN